MAAPRPTRQASTTRLNKPGRVPVKRKTPLFSNKANAFQQLVTLLKPPSHEYVYAPITDKQIRLLHLQPATKPLENIVCLLETVNVVDLPNRPYEALSYTWGDGEANNEIRLMTAGPDISSDTFVKVQAPRSPASLDPKSRWIQAYQAVGPKSFFVTHNLYRALRRFREGKIPLILWVDAICINQPDQAEKSHQISIMADIYSRAICVRVWLGEQDHAKPGEESSASVPVKYIRGIEDEGSRPIALKVVGEVEEESTTTKAVKFVGEILNLDLLDSLVIDEKYVKDWAAMAKLMRCEWFSRRWVVQELAMAKEAYLYVGDDLVHWEDFAEAVALFARESEKVAFLISESREFRHSPLGDVRASGAASIVEITKNLFRWAGTPQLERLTSLETLVSSLLMFEASDPRDTIYGLLSIAKDVPNTSALSQADVMRHSYAAGVSLVADYNKNLLEVYKDFVAFCVVSGSLDVICRHWAPNTRRPLTPDERLKWDPERPSSNLTIELPSWIPLLANSPFGIPANAIDGQRVNADDLVGPPDRKRYDAARGTKPDVKFGEVDTLHTQYAFVPDKEKSMLLQNEIPPWTAFNHKESAECTMVSGRHRRSDGCLYVRGFEVDRIKDISARLNGTIHKEGLRLGGCLDVPSDGDETPEDYLWRTLVADRAQNGENPPLWYRRALQYCLVNRRGSFDIPIRSLLASEKSSAMREFLQRVSNVTWDKKLMSLEGKFMRLRDQNSSGSASENIKHKFGLAPTGAEMNDIICILLGCSVPIVLREKGKGAAVWYEFIGEAYIYGMMDGEALPQPGSEPLDEANLREMAREFRLR